MNAKIGLEDVRLHAPHGYYDEENLMGNEFSIDVEVESSITMAATGDDLGGTVNYSTIHRLLQIEMRKPTKLLEALAYRMAKRIQDQFDDVQRVKLRLRKLNPPLGGKVGAAFVEIELGGSGPLGMGGGLGGDSAFGQKQVFDEGADDDFGGGGQTFGTGGFGDDDFDLDDFDDEDF